MIKLSKMQKRMQKGTVKVSHSIYGEGSRTLPKEEVVEEELMPVVTNGRKYVTFMSRNSVMRYEFGPSDVLISISDTGVEPPYLSYNPVEMLALAFHDSVTAASEKQQGHRWIQREDGEKIVDFVLKHENARNIIVHCNYGQSRSKAAALAIAEITKREVFFESSRGSIRRFRENDDDGFYNRRVNHMILAEYEMRPETIE